MARVVIEDSAIATLEACIDFLRYSLQVTAARAYEIAESLLTSIEAQLGDFPLSAPICELTLALGISDYREWIVEQYRVIYRYHHDSDEVSVLVIAHQRQDFRRLLFDYQLLY